MCCPRQHPRPKGCLVHSQAQVREGRASPGAATWGKPPPPSLGDLMWLHLSSAQGGPGENTEDSGMFPRHLTGPASTCSRDETLRAAGKHTKGTEHVRKTPSLAPGHTHPQGPGLRGPGGHRRKPAAGVPTQLSPPAAPGRATGTHSPPPTRVLPSQVGPCVIPPPGRPCQYPGQQCWRTQAEAADCRVHTLPWLEAVGESLGGQGRVGVGASWGLWAGP